MDETLTMTPGLPAPVIHRTARWVRATWTLSRSRRRASQSDIDTSGNGSLSPAWPALLTRMSTEPRSATMAGTIAARASGSSRSAVTAVARRPSAVICSHADSSSVPEREVTHMSAPASARPMAMARPMPRPAPVTSALRPSRRNLCISGVSRCGEVIVLAPAGARRKSLLLCPGAPGHRRPHGPRPGPGPARRTSCPRLPVRAP